MLLIRTTEGLGLDDPTAPLITAERGGYFRFALRPRGSVSSVAAGEAAGTHHIVDEHSGNLFPDAASVAEAQSANGKHKTTQIEFVKASDPARNNGACR